MSLIKRFSELFQQKAYAAFDRAEEPIEALELAYRKQFEAYQAVRQSVSEVLTSQKRLEFQSAQLGKLHEKLLKEAEVAVENVKDDLARTALARANRVHLQLDVIHSQIDELRTQHQSIVESGEKLRERIEAIRTQKEALEAKLRAHQAMLNAAEQISGLTDGIADVALMLERVRNKVLNVQARSLAIGDLVAKGAFDHLNLSSQTEVDRRIAELTEERTISDQLASLKQRLAAVPAATPAGDIVVRIHGEDQYRLPAAGRPELDAIDAELTAAIQRGEDAAYRACLAKLLAFVRRGERSDDRRMPSQLVLPSEDMSLGEARRMLAGGSTDS